MLDRNIVFNQLCEGQVPNDARVYHPQKITLWFFLLFVPFIVVFFLLFTVLYGLILIFLGNEKMIASSFLPIYTHYPYLILPQLILPFFYPYLVWRIENRHRDMMLVLFPEGFIRYKPWSNKRDCQAKVIEYAKVQEIARKAAFAGIAVRVSYKDGTYETVFLTTKSKGSLVIREQIINDCARFSRQAKLPEKF